MTSPMKKVPEWDVIDSSKVKDLLTCERLFFFKHRLGWQPEGPNIHLVFGEAWHKAQAVLALKGPDALDEAIDVATAHFREDFSEESDMDNFPKCPASFRPALEKQQQLGLFRDYEVAEFGGEPLIEVAGAVPVTKDKVIHFRMDAVVEVPMPDKVIVVQDHKTAGRLNSFWHAQWIFDISIATYIHAARCMFGEDKVWGAIISGCVFRKTGYEFPQCPIRKMDEHLMLWYEVISDAFDTIDYNDEMTSKMDLEAPIMQAWPQRPTSCVRYMRICPFHDLCFMRPNPVDPKYGAAVPTGFVWEFWDPSAKEQEARVVYHGEEGTKSKEEKGGTDDV